MIKIKLNTLAKQAMNEKEVQQQNGGMNKYKYSLFLLTMLIVSSINAQLGFSDHHSRKYDLKKVVDTCVYRVTYKFVFTFDTVKKSKATDKESLDIGKNISRYYSVYADMLDSVNYEYLNRKQSEKMAGSDIFNAKKEVGLLPDQIALYEDIYTNYPVNDFISVFTGICKTEYMYSESIPKFNWGIAPDTTTVIGYKCMKATTKFRGREYIAWFAPSLPIKKGPWKFNGLPGLILKVSDTKGYFEWTAIGIEKPQNETIISYGYNKKTDRITVTRMLHKRWQDPLGMAQIHVNTSPKGTMMMVLDPATEILYIVYENGIGIVSGNGVISSDKGIVSGSGIEPTEGGFSYPYIPIPELDLINHEK